MTNRFDEFITHMTGARVIEDSAKTLRNSKNPNVVGRSRVNLAELINSHLGDQTVVPDSPAETLLTYVPDEVMFHKSEAYARFEEAPELMLTEGMRGREEEFKAAYLDVTPFRNGTSTHDSIVDYHEVVYGLDKLLESLGNVDNPDNPDVWDKIHLSSIPFIKKAIEVKVGGEFDTSNGAIQNLVNLALQSYASSGQERAIRRMRSLQSDLVNEINEMLPEDQRASYSMRNLRALVDNNQLEAAAESLYKIIG